jgi:hypothetical protein
MNRKKVLKFRHEHVETVCAVHEWGGWVTSGLQVFKRCENCKATLSKREYLLALKPREIRVLPVANEHLEMWGY